MQLRAGSRPPRHSVMAQRERTPGRACSQQRLLSCSAHPPRIDLIITDVDGTLLNSQQELTPRVEQAVKAAEALGVPLVVATGKARGPWAHQVLPRLGQRTPGVFLQGLLVCDADGKVLYQRELPHDVIRDCVAMANELGYTLTAYCNERILCAETDEHTDRLLFYKEPTPEPVGDMAKLAGSIPVQKLIFMAPQPRIDAVRPRLEAALAGRATLTSALEGMVEVLPLGASKGAGVEWLLEYMGVPAAHIMAMGDGENDVEMLQLAGWGVAMGNAGPKARAAADTVVAANDADGVAEAITKYVIEPRQAEKLVGTTHGSQTAGQA